MSSRTKASGVADAGAKADSIRQRTLHESSDQGCLPVHNGVLPSEEKVPQKQSGSQCSLHVWSRKTLLNRKDIPKHLQFNPYIETGYRPLLSAWGCIMSLFYFHNETINIITHGVPMLYILLRWRTLLPWSEITVPLLPWTHLVSTVSPWVGSTIYHLFMNHRAGETCYKSLLHLDMFGIWITQSFGALTTVYASVFCLSEAWIWKVLVVYCFVSLWCLYKDLLAVLGGFVGALRVPEKWIPGRLDLLANSHHIMHVVVVYAVYHLHQGAVLDMVWLSGNTTCPLVKSEAML
ncbi:progestin and adipoQ receptor family member 4-like isoform X4 [Penaeus japonicus]|uniref:progestin and adipoQ receptor family member 4-like isoform X4 n=1 Tax=Penaeus japonicus TaxID=27405 RepID=UPI001C714B61|nr:progestin and adipoQ receptor family member 4-like isoform X4 [Penaeus japonicus]